MTVWIVLRDLAHPHEAGRDLRIEAVFASKADAEAFIAIQRTSGYEIQEFDVMPTLRAVFGEVCK